MQRRAWMAPLFALALVGCGSGATKVSPSTGTTIPSPSVPAAAVLHLPARGLAVEAGPHRVVLYSLTGHHLATVAAQIANYSVSLHPWLKDRLGRELALRGGTVTFGDVHGTAPAFFSTGKSVLKVHVNGTTTIVRAPASIKGQGGWVMGVPSPSGRWVLAQWSGECEVPNAYMVDVRSGRVSPVGSESVESFALGWLSNDRALVQFPFGACSGSATKPGVYVVSPTGRPLRFVVPTRRADRAFMWGS